MQAQRVRVDDFGPDNWLGGVSKTAGAVGDGWHAVERKYHVLGGEWAAIMECHALAQLDLPGFLINGFPGNGQRRLGLVFRIKPDQRLEHVTGKTIIRTQIMVMRVHRREGATHRDGQFPILCRLRTGEWNGGDKAYRHRAGGDKRGS